MIIVGKFFSNKKTIFLIWACTLFNMRSNLHKFFFVSLFFSGLKKKKLNQKKKHSPQKKFFFHKIFNFNIFFFFFLFTKLFRFRLIFNYYCLKIFLQKKNDLLDMGVYIFQYEK